MAERRRRYRQQVADMMTPKVKAICNTLAASVQSGLNATLTPEDCRELLRAILAAQPVRTPAKVSKREPRPLDRIVAGVADIAAGFVEDFAAEINAVPKGRRKRDS